MGFSLLAQASVADPTFLQPSVALTHAGAARVSVSGRLTHDPPPPHAGKIFHEGGDTQDQDYRYSWTPSTTNPETGVWEASGGPRPMYNGTVANPSYFAFDVDDEEMTVRPALTRCCEVLTYVAYISPKYM